MIKYSKCALVKRSYYDYKKSDITSIMKAYKKPSMFKVAAWNECCRICKSKDGYDLKIIAFNTYHFTCGFLYDFRDDYGNVLDTFYVYITPAKIREISLSEKI